MSKQDKPEDLGKVRKFEHPGRGRARARLVPKGRQVEPQAEQAIRALLGERPRERHLLIEYLHLVQDEFGQISAEHLAALDVKSFTILGSGAIESLNLAAAVNMCVYELNR